VIEEPGSIKEDSEEHVEDDLGMDETEDPQSRRFATRTCQIFKSG
jgi:hypothetical protein